MKNKAGRPSDITDELLRKIKACIIDGKDFKTTAKICGIVESTFYCWTADNYLKLSDKIEGWKRDRKLNLADRNIDGILCLGIGDKDSLKVVADMSKFVKETLDKTNYSKRSELTGSNGQNLIPKPLLGGESNKNGLRTDNSNEEAPSINEED